MSIIHIFYLKIYELLSSSLKIKNVVDNIYIKLVQDAKYPFLVVRINNITNMSNFNANIYDIDFTISIFTKDRNYLVPAQLAEYIIEEINNKKIKFSEYELLGVRLNRIDMDESTDLVTSKMEMKFKTSLIKK